MTKYNKYTQIYKIYGWDHMCNMIRNDHEFDVATKIIDEILEQELKHGGVNPLMN